MVGRLGRSFLDLTAIKRSRILVFGHAMHPKLQLPLSGGFIMSDSESKTSLSRRAALQAGAALAAIPLAGMFPAIVRAQSKPATKVLDFTTSADVVQAEK